MTTAETKSMRVIQLEASAFKRLRAVRLDLHEGVNQINGRNGQGKSSVLDAIAAVLGGGTQIPDKPIRKGNKKAEIRAKIGTDGPEYIIERSFTESGSYLKLTAADGSDIKSPQAFLDRLYGAMAFDPLEFTRMQPRQQVDVLKRVTGLEAEFAKLDAAKADAVKAKTEASRTVRTLELQLAALPDVPGPDEEVSMADLADKVEAAQKEKAHNDKARAWLKDKEKVLAGLEAEIEELERKLFERKTARDTTAKSVAEWTPKVAAMMDPDIKVIQDEMRNIEARNEAARRRRERKRLSGSLEAARDAERDAARKSEDAEASRERALSEAELPVKGLRFDEDGVTLNGIPFEQSSTAEQIRASVAMGLAQNPTLRVMLVREGSLLDAESMTLLAELAEEWDAQLIVERVTDGNGVGITIEDGEVVKNGGGA